MSHTRSASAQPRTRVLTFRLIAATGLLITLSVKAQVAPPPSAAVPATPPSARPIPTTTAPGTSTNSGLEEKAPVQLSPFEVNTSQDRGFATADTYSGGRLATALADTAAPYDVVNQQMIEALGITELREVLDWTTNSFNGLDGSGGGYFFNLPVLNVTRGAQTGQDAFRQTNFFPYFSQGNGFDVERYDIGRGPNAVVFGLGGLSAVSMTMFKQARTDKPFETVDMQTGAFGQERVTIDVNRPVTDNFALRMAGIYDNSPGWRVRDDRLTRGGFGTFDYKPFPNTEIHGSYERVQNNVTQAFITLNDDFGGWDGKSVFNGLMTDAQRAGTAPTASGTILSNTGNDQGVTRLGTNYYVYDQVSGVNSLFSYTNSAITDGAGATATTPVAGYTYANAGGISFNTSGQPIIGGFNIPGNRFAAAAANSYFRLPSQQLDNNINNPSDKIYQNDVQLSIDQHIGNDVYVQIAGDVNHVDGLINNSQSGLQNIFIDINQTLPNGAPNPGFLQPYADANYRTGRNQRNNDSVRAAIAYLHDFGKWGNYSVNLIAGDQEAYITSRGYQLSIEQNADNRNWDVSDLIKERIYLYGNHGYNPPTGPVQYVNPITGVSSTITPQWVTTAFGTTDSINHDAYGMAALNAKYFGGKLVLQTALRDDITEAYTRIADNEDLYPSNWNGQQIIWRPNAPANWSTLTYYPKSSAGVITGPLTAATARPTTTNALGAPIPQPQYAGDVFQDDFSAPNIVTPRGITHSFGGVYHVTPWLSADADSSSSFQPNTSPTPTILGTNLPNVLAHGWDIGARISLLNGGLSIGYNHYWNYSTGNHTVPSQVSTINSLLADNPEGNPSTTSTNALGLPQLFPGGNDTTDLLVFGDEINVTANPLRGWRVTGNWSFPYVYNVNADPLLRGYMAANAQNLITIVTQDGGVVDTTQHPNGAPGLASAPTLPPGTIANSEQAAVNNYNNLYSSFANVVTGKQLQTRELVLNFFTDYTIQTGKFKGVDIGIGEQYRGRNLVGYTASNTVVSPANPQAAVPAPNASPYIGVFTSGYSRGTGTLGYHWKAPGGTPVFFNLRITNLWAGRQIIYNNGASRLAPLDNNYASPAREAVPNTFGEFRQPTEWSFETKISL